MTAIQQAARELALEIARNQRIGSIHDPVILQERKRIDRSKGKAGPIFHRAKAMSQFQRQSVIGAVADRNQLLNFAF